MTRFSIATLVVALCAGAAFGQQATASSGNEHVKVYSSEPGIKQPQLLPLNIPIIPIAECKQKVDGTVELSMLVDTAGRARNIMFVRPLGTDVDKFALQIAGDERFTPGSLDGVPVVVAVTERISILSCMIESKDNSGNTKYALLLRSGPEQKLAMATKPPDQAVLSGDPTVLGEKVIQHLLSENKNARVPVLPPVPLVQHGAEYTLEARKAGITGTCVVELIVDAQGMPQNLKVHRSLEPQLDQNALYAVSRWRFRPALKDGEPVSVVVNVEVNFRFH